jgi:single-strand DNA-binding protein
MAYLNKCFLIGNLTRNPELRVTPKGTAICKFGLAVNRQFKDESGQQRDETTFIDIEAWGKQGELVAKYLVKGAPAMIEGRLKLEQWEDKTTNQKRSKLKVVLENVQFLGSRGAAPTESHAPASVPPAVKEPVQSGFRNFPPNQRAKAAAQPTPDIDEDVPF